ncbi:unnamed protein product [Alopecurus aequalis]
MEVMGIFLTLRHLPLLILRILILLPVVIAYNTVTMNITNNCSYTVWPAATPIGGGMRLDPGKTWTLNVPDTITGGRVWARTGCSFDRKGNGSCQTGDCGGLLACTSKGTPPFTTADFSLNQYYNNSFFDISLYQGFNVPMEFLPVQVKGIPGCSNGPRCTANITSQCPSELKAQGGCNSASMLPEKLHSVVLSERTTISSFAHQLFGHIGYGQTVYIRRTRRRQEMEDEEEDFGNLQGTPMRFTFQQLEVATEQFSDKLGEGGFGSVFKGQLGEDTIGVKQLDRAEKSHRLLVYEYMPKGSLDKWIYSRHENIAPPLEWSVRCKIITHIAKGLSYLHEECMKRIAHLDVKPQNILLDDDFNAKLSDFGLCKLTDRDMSQVVTRMRGTPGYLAPEWLTSQITEKADVYSFGVVVMEIVSGRKNLDTSRSEGSLHLITLLEEKVKNDHLVDLIDKKSEDMQAHEQDVIHMMKLAMWCLQIDCKRRPKMSEVVKVLEGTMDAVSNINHNFVATNDANFGNPGDVNCSAPPVASDVSGPR